MSLAEPAKKKVKKSVEPAVESSVEPAVQSYVEPAVECHLPSQETEVCQQMPQKDVETTEAAPETLGPTDKSISPSTSTPLTSICSPNCPCKLKLASANRTKHRLKRKVAELKQTVKMLKTQVRYVARFSLYVYSMHIIKTPISLYIPVCWYHNFCIKGAYFFQASLRGGGIREGAYNRGAIHIQKLRYWLHM